MKEIEKRLMQIEGGLFILIILFISAFDNKINKWTYLLIGLVAFIYVMGVRELDKK